MNGRPGPAPYARFEPSDLPVLTSTPARADHAVRAAGRALARLGRSDLGGHLVLTAGHDGQSGDPAAQERAVARAVERALRRRPPGPPPVRGAPAAPAPPD
ncbi:hypothetical protein [Streptomyces longwoodensis]|uniref:hypothetical protein n=1 Tax=Streptomyces longwoodensis TaxID=68231 RepID=UPI0033F9D502